MNVSNMVLHCKCMCAYDQHAPKFWICHLSKSDVCVLFIIMLVMYTPNTSNQHWTLWSFIYMHYTFLWMRIFVLLACIRKSIGVLHAHSLTLVSLAGACITELSWFRIRPLHIWWMGEEAWFETLSHHSIKTIYSWERWIFNNISNYVEG